MTLVENVFKRNYISLLAYNTTPYYLLEPGLALATNTICCTSVGLKLGQRRRQWTNVKQTLGERLVFAGLAITGSNKQTQKYIDKKKTCIKKEKTHASDVYMHTRIHENLMPIFTIKAGRHACNA